MSDQLTGLFRALSRLDECLEAAILRMKTSASSDRSPNWFRGLQISPADVERLLETVPGQPLFSTPNSEPVIRSLAGDAECFQRLRDWFQLSDFDLNVILIALAPEIDLRYERLYAYLQDDVTRKRPTVDLALNLFAPSTAAKLDLRQRFAPDAPLLKERLVHLMPEPGQLQPPLLSHYLKLDDLIVASILSERTLDRRLSAFCHIFEGEPDVAPDEEAPLRIFAQRCRAETRPVRMYFQGPAIGAKLDAARSVAKSFDSRLLVADVARGAVAGDLSESIRLAFRAARLQNDVLYLDGVDLLRHY
jgi:hypothetical protein